MCLGGGSSTKDAVVPPARPSDMAVQIPVGTAPTTKGPKIPYADALAQSNKVKTSANTGINVSTTST